MQRQTVSKTLITSPNCDMTEVEVSRPSRSALNKITAISPLRTMVFSNVNFNFSIIKSLKLDIVLFEMMPHHCYVNHKLDIEISYGRLNRFSRTEIKRFFHNHCQNFQLSSFLRNITRYVILRWLFL